MKKEEPNSSPLPKGEGRGEGEETLRKPARWRTADGADYSERRKTKLHASQSAEPLTVAGGLPFTLSLFARGEGIHHRSVVYPAGSLVIMGKIGATLPEASIGLDHRAPPLRRAVPA